MKIDEYISALRKNNKIFLMADKDELKIRAHPKDLTEEVIAEIKSRKAEILSFFRTYQKETEEISIPRADKKESYSLSSAQRRLFFLNQLDTSSLAYNMPQFVQLEGKIDQERLQTAFQDLVDRHESLRTYFFLQKDEPVQKIEKEVSVALEYSEDGDDTKDQDQVVQDFIRPFNLGEAPLLRMGLHKWDAEVHLLMVDMHHIISDGVSGEILIEDFMAIYEGHELPELAIQYKDFAEWENSEIRKKEIKEQETYWLTKFSEDLPIPELPTDFARPTVKQFAGKVFPFKLDRKTTHLLRSISIQEEATLFMTLLSIYNILLAKLSSLEDIVIGCASAARLNADVEKMIGMFVNTLPLRNYPKGDFSFKEFLGQVKESTIGAFDNQSYPFAELVEKLELGRDTSRNPLFEAWFAFQSFESTELRLSDMTLKPVVCENNISKFDLSLFASEQEEELSLYFEYSTALFKEDTIKRISSYFQQIAAEISENIDIKLADIFILPDSEVNLLTHTLNNTSVPFASEETIVSLFQKQVAKTPDNTAIIYGDSSYSYTELDLRSNKVAHFLEEVQKVKQGDLVGVMLDRELELLPVIFGVLKTGAAYVPIAPSNPKKRVADIAADANLKVLISRKKFRNVYPDHDTKIIELDTEIDKIYELENIAVEQKPASTDLAYVIYTSGTTGKPKGVMIEHHSVVNRLEWMQKAYPIGEEDVLIQKTPISFDVSVWELFWWSFQGASLVLLGPEEEKNPEKIASSIQRFGVTTMHFVPSMLRVFLSWLEQSKSKDKLNSLKQVFASGEALKPEDVRSFATHVHQVHGTRLINLYGPTEATVDVSYYECTFQKNENQIPIGKPIDNIRLYILDKNNRLCPNGVAGELHIAGVGLARGYLNREELTQTKFIEPAFVSEDRLYKTGDWVKYLTDGNIAYLGRIDSQVKIRGNRIELNEIEHVLTQYASIAESAVIAKGTEDPYLVAYYVADQEQEVAMLMTHMHKSLPAYMVPTFYVRMSALPLSSNGKLNRKALPDPEILPEKDYEAPSTKIETQLVEIWAEVLKIEKDNIGVNRNFFEIGGHSTAIVILTNKINERMKVNISIADMFRLPTVKSQADHIFSGDNSIQEISQELDDAFSDIADTLQSLSPLFD